MVISDLYPTFQVDPKNNKETIKIELILNYFLISQIK